MQARSDQEHRRAKVEKEIVGRFNQLFSKLRRKAYIRSDSLDTEVIKCVILKFKQSPKDGSSKEPCTQYYSFSPEFEESNIFALLLESAASHEDPLMRDSIEHIAMLFSGDLFLLRPIRTKQEVDDVIEAIKHEMIAEWKSSTEKGIS